MNYYSTYCLKYRTYAGTLYIAYCQLGNCQYYNYRTYAKTPYIAHDNFDSPEIITISTIKLTCHPMSKNTHTTDFFVFYRMNLFNLLAQNSNDDSYIFLCYMPEVPNVGLICWLEIVMIIHISFCTTCQKFRMLVS